MYKLYGTKHTSTCAVKAALTEAGAPFEEVEITTRAKQHLTVEYRQINPRQQVPFHTAGRFDYDRGSGHAAAHRRRSPQG